MRLNDAITDYLGHIRHERGLSRTTCEHYTSWLRSYTAWLATNGFADDPTVEDAFTTPVLRHYQYAKAKTGIRPRTMHSAFHALRGLGVFLVANGLLTENPVSGLTMPKKDAAKRTEATDGDVQALFAACDRLPKARQVALSRAVLSVLAHGGLRREEACDLRVSDVNLPDKSLLVQSGKGSKSRKVFVCQEAVSALREWLTIREKDCKHDYLFAIDRNRRVHHTGIATIIATLKAVAGLRDKELTPHVLRHWSGTNMLKNGANIRDVSAFLGHTELATTAKYLHTSEEQLRSISELTALRPKEPEPPTKPGREPERERRGLRRRIAR